jgi:hypothetical protein
MRHPTRVLSTVERAIWCQTRHRILHGRAYREDLSNPNWWQRLLRVRQQPEIYFEFAPATRDVALAAFEAFLDSPAAFSATTRDGGRIDFHLSKDKKSVWLDFWLDKAPLTEAATSIDDARRLLNFIYGDHSDREVDACARDMAAVVKT